MASKEYLNSINPNREKPFPYLVREIFHGKSSTPDPGFHIMHWHEEFQFLYVSSGSLSVQTLSETMNLSTGEALYLGPEVIHRIEAPPDTHYYNFLFPAKILRFYPGCPANEYLSAFFTGDFMSPVHLFPTIPWCRQALEKLEELVRLENEKPSLYEYEVLLCLFSLLLILKKHASHAPRLPRGGNAEKTKRILQYIADHYEDEISLEDLAESVHLSKSGCLRCFRLTLHTTPYKYLLEYRLQQAAERLLATDAPIGQIALDTGFRQVSLFGKYFKEKTGLTPKEYRTAGL